MIVLIAFRNLTRHKRRSIISGLSLAFGFALVSFSLAFSEGTYQNMIEMFTSESVGHIQVYSKDYHEKPLFYKTIKSYEKLSNKIESVDGIISSTPRVYGGFLSFFNSKTLGARLIGVDLEKELLTTKLLSKKIEGRVPEKGKYETLISRKIARILKLKLGDKLVAVGSGVDGSIANDFFTVTGIAKFEGSSLGNMIALSDISVVQEFYSLGNQVHEVVVKTKSYKQSEKLALLLNKTINDPELTIYPWEKSQKTFYKMMRSDQIGNLIFLAILMFVLGLGVLNAVYMNVYENMKDYAVMLSLGTSPFQIQSIVLLEGLFLALISSAIGLVFALGFNIYFTHNGITLPNPIEYSGVVMEKMMTVSNFSVYFYPGILVIVTAAFASLIPSYHAAKADISKRLR